MQLEWYIRYAASCGLALKRPALTRHERPQFTFDARGSQYTSSECIGALYKGIELWKKCSGTMRLAWNMPNPDKYIRGPRAHDWPLKDVY